MRKRRLLLLGLWVLSLITISFYGGAVSYGFFFGVSLIPVISLIYLFCVYSRFKIYQETAKRDIVCGRPEPYYFMLQNEDPFLYASVSVRMHSDFSYVEESFDNIEYELFPGDRTTFETRIVCRYRGEYEVGVKEVVVTDFLRLFRIRYRVSGQIKAAVSPRIVRIPELLSIADLPVLLQRDAGGSTEPDILVRDYAEGDSLKQIHWKATAREGKLKTRVMTGRESQSISVCCDTRRYSERKEEYLPLENKLLEVFLATGCFFAEGGRSFSAYYGQNGAVRAQVDGLGAFDVFYKKVSEICFAKEESFEELFRQALMQGASAGGLIFCVLHEPSPAVLELTERLTEKGIIVVLYVVTDKDPAQYLKLADTRRRVAVIPVEAQLEGRL